MLLYENKAKNLLCVFAKIRSISPGKGRAYGWKHSVILSYTGAGGKEITVRTDFWNEKEPYKDNDQPRLLSDWVSRLKPGDCIVALLDTSKSDITATGVVHEEGVLVVNKGEPDELCVILGQGKAAKAFMAKDGSGVPKKAYSVGIALDGYRGTDWRCATFYSLEKPLAERAYEKHTSAAKHGNPLIILAKKAQGLSKEGVHNYIGFKIWEIPKKKPVLITLGPYRDHPISLDSLVSNGVASSTFAMEWLKYVAEELEPSSTDPAVIADFNRQRDAIRGYLNSLEPCA